MGGRPLLIKVRGDEGRSLAAARSAFGLAAAEIEPILRLPGRSAGAGFAAEPQAVWLRVSGAEEENPWDAAHGLAGPDFGIAAAGIPGVEFVEPDISQNWLLPERGAEGMALDSVAFCAFQDQDGTGGKARGDQRGWTLEDTYSEFTRAHSKMGANFEAKLRKISVAHLDTGYDPGHVTMPVNFDAAVQHDFVKADGTPHDASDKVPPGQEWHRNRGHGTATLALLAGNRLGGTAPGWAGFTDFVGGAPFARMIVVRIADWVVRFSTGTMVQGIDHAIRENAQVLSMSMGGLTSAALVDAVNLAYDSGLLMVTAAGNNFAHRPMPKSIVFPARYPRVLAACGVMADGRPYWNLEDGVMQGSHGPAGKMATAIGGFTPNTAWAKIGCGDVVDMDGAGTSAATPQVAAAAALWLAEHSNAVAAYPEPWMRVEAVRHALFASAAKSTAKMDAAETRQMIGQGVVKAAAALNIQPAAAATLTRLKPSKASWGWLDLLFNTGVGLAEGMAPARKAMLSLELTQMAQHSAEVEAAIAEPEVDDIPAAAINRYLEAALETGNPSKHLRKILEDRLGPRRALPKPGPAPKPILWHRKTLPIPDRRLRVYALDPSVAKSLNSVDVNETVLPVRWEPELGPGPVGEYLEVVDVDPASNRIYAPVDLNKPEVLAQDGLPPSEGNPQFHQQMTYAVAMTTIDHFEAALGRKALWAQCRERVPDKESGRPIHKSYEVPRLRIYPHALRTANAYYSPEKVALLFGYFPSSADGTSETVAGSTVFACLSSDIVAHEMSHALLDGLYRHLQEASNPDVPAFHEAFADIVALFQHFTMPELVRFQIAKAHGDLRAAHLLGGLARQFGQGTRSGDALRDYLGGKIGKLNYASSTEVHARGSILVLAVFEAFLAIFDRRTRDLVQLATGGTGILGEGALHPDLVERLTAEACKSARHVLRICIRALDYCPAVDITFGEYLRALITSDIDLVPNDRLHYRTAFIEAFRKRGLLPGDVRTVSEETLAWGTPQDDQPEWLDKVASSIDLGLDRVIDRSEMAQVNEENRWKMWRVLKQAFAEDPELCRNFGLLGGVPRYRADGRVLRPAAKGETTFEVLGVRPAFRVAPDGSTRTEVIANIQQRRALPLDPDNPKAGVFRFRGGATLIFDPREGARRIRYMIIKNSASETRIARQRAMERGGAGAPLRQLYFGDVPGEPFAMLHGGDAGEDDD